MADRFPLVLVGLLLLIGAVGAWVFEGAARGSFADALSTYRSEPDGSRALYLLAEESGLPVTRLHQDLQVVPEGSVPVLLGVWDRSLVETPEDPADAGTSTLFGPDAEEDGTEAEHRSMQVLEDDERDALFEHLTAGGTALFVLRTGHRQGYLDRLGVGTIPVDPAWGIRTLQPAVPSPYTRGVNRLEAKLAALLELPWDAVPLLLDTATGQPVAAEVPYGAGRAVVIAAPELAHNAALARADNAQLWLSLLETLSSAGTPTFSEYHHGFTGERSIAQFARRYGLHLACGQLLLGLLFWAGALRRFGRPRPPEETQRIGATDALFSASRILREGRHHAHAAEVLFDGLVHELARLAGVPSGSKPQWVAESLQARGRGDLAALLRRAFAQKENAHSDRGLFTLAETVSEARRALSPTPLALSLSKGEPESPPLALSLSKGEPESPDSLPPETKGTP